VDIIPQILTTLNSRRSYTLHIVGPGAEDILITGVRAVDGRDTEAVAKEVARCEVACTAVGVGALPHIAPKLAAGLMRRYHLEGVPLNILVCENLHEAGNYLRNLVAEHLPPDLRDAILANVGFVQAVVSRMVPLQTEEDRRHDPLTIRTEAYKRLPVDAAGIVGQLPPIMGVEPVSNFAAHEARKLFTHNCAHATLGYLGYPKGYTYGYEALSDLEIHATLNKVMEETGSALIRAYGFDTSEHRAHVADLMERFANRALGDTCFRLARDPIRKLAPHDRLVGAARLCEAQGVEPVALAEVIAAALRFDAAEDPSAVALQQKITAIGIEGVLGEICRIHSNERLAHQIKAAYERMGQK
jgi:mannitol-1-phosphate 5-dehydrogenase